MRILALIVTIVAVQQAPVFKTGVDFVSVDVIVTDGNDVPVPNLTKEDFEIVDRGKPQVITSFEYVDIPVATRTVDLKAPRPPAPDVASNLPSSPDSRLFAMVIDDQHIVESEIVAVKKIMTDFIAALSPDDELAMVFVGRSDLSQNFTKDVGRLLTAVDKVRDALGFGVDALGRLPSAEPGGLGKLDPTIVTKATAAASVLKNVTRALAGSGHSRRAIVYVSGGTPINPTPEARQVRELTGIDELMAARVIRDELDAVYASARQHNVPIYTIDPRGGVQPETAVRGGISVIHKFEIRQEIVHRLKIQQDRMSEIALNTGGRAFTNQSDLTRAVREIVRENGSYYLLGFYPNPSNRDGKFHEIEVKVKRPGARVRPRSGYVAPKPTPETSDTKPAMDAAISAGVNVSGLSLQAIVSPLAPAATGMRSAVIIEVTYPVPDGTRRISDDLRIRVIALDPDGKVKTSVEQNRAFTGMAPEGQAVVKFLIDDAVDLPSQALTLRIGVASRALGRTGTLQLPIEVPRADGRLAISGLALTSEDQPPIGVMSKELVADLVPFQPVLTRAFAISDTIRVFGRLFWESRDESATVTVALASARTEIQAPALTLTGVVSSGNRRQADLDTTLRLAELAPGDYVLRVTAKIGNGQTALREIPVTLR